MSKNLIIAIDGPSGSGKSTIAKYLADKLSAVYIDTGAMYRAITFSAMRLGIVSDLDAVIKMTKQLEMFLKYENGNIRVFVNDEEVTDNIRTKEVNDRVSDISKIPEVREELVKIQRKLGESNTVVAEGRDITTVVFPNADLKIFLTASIDVRAERRLKEFLDKGINISLGEVKENLEKRDRIDSGRETSPLTKADDAFVVDSTSMTIKDELDFLLKKLGEVKNPLKF